MTRKQHFNLYICACTDEGGLYRYTLDGGKLRLIEKYPVKSPMYAIQDKNTLYVILKGGGREKNSSLVKYTVNPDGSLTALPGVWDTEGEVACHLEVLDGEVYVVNYVSGNIVKIGDKVSQHEGTGPNTRRQERAHTHYVGAMPDGNLLVTDLTLDKIFTYGKSLEIKSEVSVPRGDGPRHLIHSQDGKYVYCACELNSTVCSFIYRDGEMELVNTYPLLPEDFDGYSIAAAIRLDSGKLYVSNRGHDTISVFDVDGADLSERRFISVYGKAPRDFNIFGDFIVATNQNSSTVTVIDKNTGALLDTAEAPEALCVTEVRWTK